MQQRFCQEYVIDLNGKQAAIRAGYKSRSAEVKASQLLTYPGVKAEIAKLQTAIAERCRITSDMVVQELAKVGFHNIQDFIDEKNGIVNLKNIKRNTAAAVESIKVTEIGKGKTAKKKIELKLHDKVGALEKLGRHLGIFEKDNSQQNKKVTIKVTAKKSNGG